MIAKNLLEIGTLYWNNKRRGMGSQSNRPLSSDLKMEFRISKAHQYANLKYMRAFAEAYPDFAIVNRGCTIIRRENQEVKLCNQRLHKFMVAPCHYT